jgi:hypothetical protein
MHAGNYLFQTASVAVFPAWLLLLSCFEAHVLINTAMIQLALQSPTQAVSSRQGSRRCSKAYLNKVTECSLVPSPQVPGQQCTAHWLVHCWCFAAVESTFIPKPTKQLYKNLMFVLHYALIGVLASKLTSA